jgi:subtilisin family serine protease
MKLFKLLPCLLIFLSFENTYAQNGIIKVKFTEEFVQRIEAGTAKRNQYGVPEYGITGFDSLNRFYSVQQLERVFPYSPKYEQRHRKHGLHRWYRLKTKDTNVRWASCISAYENCTFIERAEIPLEKKYFDSPVSPGGNSDRRVLEETNDPLFAQQWHYENTGQSGGTPGADIDLKFAWDIQQGSPDVVVAIIDGGLEVDHEDLAANMWVNTGELNGVEGVDDDGNGYIDDIHGYGFGDDTGDIAPHYHGVHVGGTVAAVNNNGVGVSGVAGGSGTGDGIRMMSCAVFGAIRSGGFDEAFVYAADNGAVIAQNSWGYTAPGVYEQSVLDAIDYFIANAGYDENGDPVGPMQGGLVVFAAGNDNSDADWYPGYYDAVLAVASTNHNDVKSGFSNYGDWVDIAAPGSSVYSTYIGNSYDFLSGTSMACPHVSGVAALIVSEFGETGFAPDEVWRRLVATTESIDVQNTPYTGLLGSGRLNAFSSLQRDDGIPPDPIADLAVSETEAVAATLTWTATGSSASEGRCTSYEIRYATFEITSDNFDEVNQVANPPHPKVAGDSEEFQITGLDPSTTYYFAIKAVNFFDRKSDVSNVVQATTLNASEILVEPDSLLAIVDPGESAELTFTISNVGNEVLEFSMPGFDVSASPSSAQSTKRLVIQSMEVNKGAKDTRVGNIVEQGRGDDEEGFGYSWIDSNEPGGPPFAWEDISTSGVNFRDALSDDNVAGPYPLGFDFNFYENTYNEFYVSSNGFIRFGMAGSSGCCSGQPIPRQDDINNIIAWAWRDGYPSGGAFYENFDDKTIIQFQEYGLFGGGGTATAEIILYKNGSIKLNYLQLTGYYNDGKHSVGIENENGTVGLQIAFNTPYLEDSLAIFIGTAPGFIEEVTPATGSLATGESVEVSVTVNSGEIEPGNYEKRIIISSNDPVTPEDQVYVLLHINGIPEIAVSPEDLDFGEAFVGRADTLALTIQNVGTDTLLVDSIVFHDESAFLLASSTYPVVVEAGHTTAVNVVFEASTTGSFVDSMLIHSNDLENSPKTIDLQALSVEPPVIAASPDRFDVALISGETDVQTLNIDNSAGGSRLFWNLDINYIAPTLSFERDKSNDIIRSDRDATEFFEPKSRSYFNTNPSSMVSIPFRDGFESGNYDGWMEGTGSGVREVTNSTSAEGIYSFYYQSSTNFEHFRGIQQNFEAGGQPDNVSFFIRSGSESLADGYFVLWHGESDAIWFFAGPEGKFYLNGDVGGDETFAYNEDDWYHIAFKDIDWEDKDFDYYVNGELIKADISFRNPVSIEQFDELYLYNYHASEAWWDDINIGGTPFSWLKPESAADTVMAESTSNLQIEFDAHGLNGGQYEAELRLRSNDPENPLVTLPVTLSVTGIPDISTEFDTLDFERQFIDFPVTKSVRIENVGTDSLGISNITIDNDQYTIDTTAFGLEPDQSISLTVTYTPAIQGAENAQMQILSNDPDEPVSTIALLGEAIIAPVIEATPDSLGQAVLTDQIATKTLNIANTSAGSELTWAIELSIRKEPASMASMTQKMKVLNNSGIWLDYGIDQRYPLAPGDFHELPDSPTPLTCLTIDSENQSIYGQENRGYNFYRYDIETRSWVQLAACPVHSGNNGGATFLDGKIYTSYTSQTELGIYDITTNSWERESVPISSGNIATDGEYLYVAGNVTLIRYDVVSKEATAMSSPIDPFHEWGGLEYYDGKLYGHIGDGNDGFQSYNIADDSWQRLQPLPSGAVLGAAIDPVTGRYYAYGSYDQDSWYTYDIDSNSWSVNEIPFFIISDGGLVYQAGWMAPGVYFAQGENGTGFARFETEAPIDWLSVDIEDGTIAGGQSQEISVTFDASGMETGLYEASVVIISNDPSMARMVVPVAMQVPGDAPPTVENQHFVVQENRNHGYEIGQIEAHDPDNDILTFHIDEGNSSNAFALNPRGMLMVNDSAQFDFEVGNQHELTVGVTDGWHGDLATITIEVSDVNEVPSIENQVFSINENSIEGHVVGQIVATDMDEDELTFSIVQGNESGAFSMTTAGELAVGDSSRFDYEINPAFTLEVQVYDGELGQSAQISVNLANLPEIADVTFSVEENVPRGHLIGTIDAGVESTSLVYEIIDGNQDQSFGIDNDGNLTVLDSADIDYELATEHHLTVRAADELGSSEADLTIVIIDLDDVITGLEDNTSQLLVYPNPTSNDLTIESTLPIRSTSILDATGRAVKIKGYIDKNRVLLDVKHLARGSYYLVIETEENTTTRRFIRE